LSSKFSEKWETMEEKGIREALRPSDPLKPKIEQAIRRVQAQINRLNQAAERLSQRDKAIFAKIVDAYAKHDMKRANVFATELSQLGDVVVTLAPATTVLQKVAKGISGVLPTAERELGQVGTLLSEIIFEAGHSTGMTLDFEVANEDARQILSEAAIVAEEKMKEKFPELPTGLTSAEKTSTGSGYDY